MTQSSRPQSGNITLNPAYIDAGPWSRDQWAERIYAVYTGDDSIAGTRTRLRGVIPTNDSMLVVTNPAGVTIRVGTGVGIAQGTLLFNNAVVDFTPNTPGIASRTDKVVLVENNTNVPYDGTASGVILDFPTDLTDYSAAASLPPYTCRLAILRGDAVTGNPTALIQTVNYWMIELARFNITNVPAVNTLTDNREFANIEKIVGVHSDDDDTIKDALIIGTEVDDGAGANDLGVGIRAKLENSNDDNEDAGQLAWRWTDATNGSEDSRLEVRLSSNNALNLSAVISAPVSVSVDGNVRGEGAVDFQQRRGAAAQVASGDFAFLAGYQSTASGDYTGVIGANNTAAGDYAMAFGRNAVASGASSFAEGFSPEASGIAAHAEGYDTEASGDYSHAEGYQTEASGDYAHASGLYAVADHFAQEARASDAFATEGDAQTSLLTASRYLATHGLGTYYELYLDGANPALLTIPASSAWAVEALVIGMTANAAQHWGYQVLGTITRDAANNTTVGGTATTALFESDAGYDAMLVADDANEALLVSVGRGGIASDYAIRWVAKIRLTQVRFPA